MDDALLMGEVQGRADLIDDPPALQGQQRSHTKPFMQRPAREIGHDDVVVTVGLAEGQDRDDVGMLEAPQQLDLAVEPAAEFGVGGDVRGEDLDGHRAPVAHVPGAVHRRHATLTDGIQDGVVSQRAPD